MKSAVFLDRDGTINREVHYLSDPARFELLVGAGDALRRLADAGHLLVVITNQSGISRGYFGEGELAAVHARMEQELAAFGVRLAGIYSCPALPGDGDPDRKPGTGMIERAAAELGIDLASSWMIGDKTADVLAGRNAGLRTVLVKTGYGGSDAEYEVQPDAVAADLAGAADIVLARQH